MEGCSAVVVDPVHITTWDLKIYIIIDQILDEWLSINQCLKTFNTLQDVFITYEMRRFSRNFAIFSDRQNFGRRNRIRRIIFSLFQ